MLQVVRDSSWFGAVAALRRGVAVASATPRDEIARLLAAPSSLGVHTLRLDPLWDPIRSHPRFQALLTRYGGRE